MTEKYFPETNEDTNDKDQTLTHSAVPHAPDYDAENYQYGQYARSKDKNSAPTWKSDKPVDANPNGVNTVVRTPKVAVPPAPPLLQRESAARERARQRRGRGRRKGEEWAWVIIAMTMFGVVVMISMSIFFFLRSSQNAPEVIPTASANLSALPTPANFRTDRPAGSGETVLLDDGSTIILEPWDGHGRFTVLMLGLDRRPGETGLSYRTDTMMLVSIDPQTQTLGILSIPRDLYVSVPGYSQLQRINTPMLLGEIQQPGYGPVLAMETVQYNLGIRVNDYLAVDFQAFVDLVDSIGGIDVTTDYTINDPYYPNMFYGYDPFYLAAGTHHLDGLTSLKFARTRHGDNDFERANRQQQVIYAIRDQILNLNMLPQMIVRAPSLLSSWDDNVYTNLNLDQMIRLAWYLKDIPTENIRTGVIDYNYSQPFTTSEGAAVLIPNRSRMGSLMVEVFGENYSQ